MKDQAVLMGCYLSVRVHLAVSNLNTEIIAFYVLHVCVCIYLDICISKERKNITLAKLLSCLLPNYAFVTA